MFLSYSKLESSYLLLLLAYDISSLTYTKLKLEKQKMQIHQIDYSSEKAESLVIFIHGYGANGKDLLSLAGPFSKVIKNAIFVAPDAPFVNPFYPNSYYWFELENFSQEYLEKQVNKVVPLVEELISSMQKKYDLNNKNTYIMGFSQGAMLTLHTGLSQAEPFKALVSFSGGCLDQPQNDYVKNKSYSILSHGKQDDVLPWQYTENAANFLTSKSVPHEVIYLENDRHTISELALMQVIGYLRALQ